MPRLSTYPKLYDEVLQLNITKLKNWGYLESNSLKSGVIDWSRNGLKHSSISLKTYISENENYLELDYKYNDQPRKYQIPLVSVPSNLGKGSIWYFLCPQTQKRCRKLYLIGGYFLHRTAFNGCMYSSQTKSKVWRQLDALLGNHFILDEYYLEIYSKHFKKHYKGKPTKRYLKLLQKIARIERREISELTKFI